MGVYLYRWLRFMKNAHNYTIVQAFTNCTLSDSPLALILWVYFRQGYNLSTMQYPFWSPYLHLHLDRGAGTAGVQSDRERGVFMVALEKLESSASAPIVENVTCQKRTASCCYSTRSPLIESKQETACWLRLSASFSITCNIPSTLAEHPCS